MTPGHTPGCTSWGGTVTVAGDSLTFVSICSLTVLSAYTLLGPQATYPGIARHFCESVRHLRSLSADVFLAPHPGFFDLRPKHERLLAGDTRAFVDNAGYHAYLDRAEAAVEQRLRDEGHAGGCATLIG